MVRDYKHGRSSLSFLIFLLVIIVSILIILLLVLFIAILIRIRILHLLLHLKLISCAYLLFINAQIDLRDNAALTQERHIQLHDSVVTPDECQAMAKELYVVLCTLTGMCVQTRTHKAHAPCTQAHTHTHAHMHMHMHMHTHTHNYTCSHAHYLFSL